jgi:large subunit ribosomal protein L20
MKVKSGVARRKRHKKILKLAKGYRGGRSRLYRTAKEAVARAGRFSYFGRKIKKRDFRSLWIIRINAALFDKDISYSRFIYGLRKANVSLNRKAISQLAIEDPSAFNNLIEIAKAHQQ